jgi:hypothetical protein
VGCRLAEHGTPFYLSYARARDSAGNLGTMNFSDQLVSRFFADLSENVAQLIAMPAGADIGFMDTAMQSGMNWLDELLHSLGTCQVLIPLLSVPYLHSEWCGREWYAFSQRTSQALPGTGSSPRQGHIIPVLWAPVPFPLPSPVKEEMIFSPTSTPDRGLPGEYAAHGLYGLLRMGREDSYQIITWQLAVTVAKVYSNLQLKFRKFRVEDLQNAFDERPLV